MDKKRTIVVALGGNALQRQGEAASEHSNEWLMKPFGNFYR